MTNLSKGTLLRFDPDNFNDPDYLEKIKYIRNIRAGNKRNKNPVSYKDVPVGTVASFALDPTTVKKMR